MIMRFMLLLVVISCLIPAFSQEGGLGSYLSRTTSMAVRAETLKEEEEDEAFVGWLEGLIITRGTDADSLYGFVKYDIAEASDVIGFKLEGANGQRTIDIRRVNSFSFLERGKKYIRYFLVVPRSGKKPDVLEKVVAGEITYWKKAKVYHYGSRSSGAVTIPKVEYDYFFSVGEDLLKVKNFKKQLTELAAPFNIDPIEIAKEKELKLSDAVQRAMLIYHVNDRVKNLSSMSPEE